MLKSQLGYVVDWAVASAVSPAVDRVGDVLDSTGGLAVDSAVD